MHFAPSDLPLVAAIRPYEPHLQMRVERDKQREGRNHLGILSRRTTRRDSEWLRQHRVLGGALAAHAIPSLDRTLRLARAYAAVAAPSAAGRHWNSHRRLTSADRRYCQFS